MAGLNYVMTNVSAAYLDMDDLRRYICSGSHGSKSCTRTAKWIVAAPYMPYGLYVCGIHRRGWNMDICYRLPEA